MLDFSLSDQVYARARLADVSSVNLWLGAGVMLEYSLEDAKVGGAVQQAFSCAVSAATGCAR